MPRSRTSSTLLSRLVHASVTKSSKMRSVLIVVETLLHICRLEDAKAGALPADAETTATIEAALLPWHPERHGLWPDTFRAAVTVVMLLQQRLKRGAEQRDGEEQAARAAGEEDGGEQQRARRAGRQAVFIPHELWVLWVVPDLPRLAWGAAGSAAHE